MSPPSSRPPGGRERVSLFLLTSAGEIVENKIYLLKIIGRQGFGPIGGYPPTTWRYVGTRNGTCMMEHVKHPSQSSAYPDQGVTVDDVLRIVGVSRCDLAAMR